jgi:hypothetical protein
MPGGVSIPTEIVLGIHGDLPRQASKGMGMCQKCFSNLLFHTEACWEVYPHPPKLFQQFILTYQGMQQKCFGNLPYPTEVCQEVYPYPPKLFRQFMVTFCGKPAKPSEIFWSFMVTLPNALWSICLPSKNILELYLGERAIALHGMYESILWSHVRVDYSNKKQKWVFEKNIIKLSKVVAFHRFNNQTI